MAKSGTRIGRYELLAVLGSGGMGTVHLARRVGMAGFERAVAIKQLHPHLIDSPEFLAMFMDEARLAGRIRHPNVVDVHDVESIDGQLVMVMTYVEGASLQQITRRVWTGREQLPVGVAVRVMHDALLGLHAAHELRGPGGEPLGLVHRDVSPQNVLVGVDGVTRVTDFGVAKAAGRLMSTLGNTLKGKLGYLAPEQLRGEPIDRRVDVFAAGILLWECLSGQRLFHGESEGDILTQITQKAIDPPSRFRPDLPLALDEACLKALERDRDRRYPDAATFARSLAGASRAMSKPEEVGAFVELRMCDLLGDHRRSLETPHGAPTRQLAVVAAEAETQPMATTARTPRRRWGVLLVPLAVVGLASWALASSPRRERAQAHAAVASRARSTLALVAAPEPSSVPAAPSASAPAPPPPVKTPAHERPRPPAKPTAAPTRPDPGEFVPETR